MGSHMYMNSTHSLFRSNKLTENNFVITYTKCWMICVLDGVQYISVKIFNKNYWQYFIILFLFPFINIKQKIIFVCVHSVYIWMLFAFFSTRPMTICIKHTKAKTIISNSNNLCCDRTIFIKFCIGSGLCLVEEYTRRCVCWYIALFPL